MTGKNIVFTRPGIAEVWEEIVRKPNSDEVVVQLACSTISSGTERANLIGDAVINIYGKPGDPVIFPRRCGYSSAGIVTEVGSGVTSVSVGDRVAVGGSTHSQYVTVPEDAVHPIDFIPFSDAALFYIATFPLAAIRKCRLEIGESAIIMGMGVLGLMAIPLLKSAGATPVIAVDPSPEKRKKALACGADYALSPFDENFSDTVKAITNGGANVGIEVTGIGAGLDGILDCMARFGRVALLGCTRNSDFPIDYYRKVHGPGIALIGAHTMARPKDDSSSGWWTTRDDMRTLINLTRFGRISLADMVDETHSPNEALDVFHRLATEKTFPIVQFDWGKL